LGNDSGNVGFGGVRTNGPGRQNDRAYFDRRGRGFYNRPKWQPVKRPAEPIPKLLCALCGKPISEPASAVSDAAGENTYHFDCALSQVKKHETLMTGETIAYIGGGRFGVVRFNDPTKRFTIERIIDWDKQDERLPWRQIIAEHYSRT
jgi:hypothetical protein